MRATDGDGCMPFLLLLSNISILHRGRLFTLVGECSLCLTKDYLRTSSNADLYLSLHPLHLPGCRIISWFLFCWLVHNLFVSLFRFLFLYYILCGINSFEKRGWLLPNPIPTTTTGRSRVKRSRRSGGTERRGQRFTPGAVRWSERALDQSDTKRDPEAALTFVTTSNRWNPTIVYFFFMKRISFQFLYLPGDATPR